MEDVRCNNGGNEEEYDSVASSDLEVRDMLGFKVIHLQNVPLHTTIGDLKLKILRKMAELRGSINKPARIADPELMALVVFNYDGFPFPGLSEDDTQSFRDFLSHLGYFTLPSPDRRKMFSIKLRIVVECVWYQMANAFARAKKRKEEGRDDYDGDGDGNYSSTDSDDEPYIEDLLIRQRPPRNMLLAEDKQVLRVIGRLHVEAPLDDGTIKRRRVAYMGGLRCDLKDIVKMSTTAKHVLLISTSSNLDLLHKYRAHLNRDIENDPNDNILVLLVTWDRFSYLFLRKLRKSIGPSVPIIAITDSNLHHLDLLAFLDSPPRLLPSLYGWDLSQDCLALDIMDDVQVDIKWAGLRPSEAQDQKTLAPATPAVSIADSPDYDMVCNQLDRHLRLLKKPPAWLQELELFKKYPLDMRLRSLAPSWVVDTSDVICSRYVVKEYFPNKFANKEWI